MRQTLRLLTVLTTAGLMASCGGSSSLPRSDRTGTLTIRIARADLGLPPIGRGGEAPLIVVTLSAGEDHAGSPYFASLDQDVVELTIRDLKPAPWSIAVSVRLDGGLGAEIAAGQTTVVIEAGRITAAFVPLVGTPPAPTVGSLNLGVGTLVDRPNGTETSRGDALEVTVRAPTAYLDSTPSEVVPRAARRLRIVVVACDAGAGRYFNNLGVTLSSGDTPEVDLIDGNVVAVYVKAEDSATLRWNPPLPTYAETIRVETRRGGLLPDGPNQALFLPTDGEDLVYTYPLIN